MRILVIGATGMLGDPVARRLMAAGYTVRLMVRDVVAARQRFGAPFEIVAGDVTSRATLDAAMVGCEAVYASLRGGNTLDSYARVERGGAANIAASARGAGVCRIGWLSGAGIGEAPPVSPLIAVKAAAIAAIEDSGLEFTIFKPTHFMESLPMFVRNGRATVIGQQPHRYRYLAAADYADVVARAMRLPQAAGQSLNLFGPEAFTMAEALGIYCAAVHPGMKVGQLPLWVVRVAARLTRNPELGLVALLFDAFQRMGEPGDPAVAEQLFGRPTTTLGQWCREQAARAAGKPA